MLSNDVNLLLMSVSFWMRLEMLYGFIFCLGTKFVYFLMLDWFDF